MQESQEKELAAKFAAFKAKNGIKLTAPAPLGGTAVAGSGRSVTPTTLDEPETGRLTPSMPARVRKLPPLSQPQ